MPMYQALLLSGERLRSDTGKLYSTIQVCQIKRHDTLTGFLPDSAVDALIVCKEFEHHPVIAQVRVLAKKCVLFSVGAFTLEASVQVATVAEALEKISRPGTEPPEKRLPYRATLSFLKTLTNPVRATKLDEQILGLFPDYQFFACILETAKHRSNLLPYIYHQIMGISSNCLAYRFDENRALCIVYAKSNIQEM